MAPAGGAPERCARPPGRTGCGRSAAAGRLRHGPPLPRPARAAEVRQPRSARPALHRCPTTSAQPAASTCMLSELRPLHAAGQRPCPRAPAERPQSRVSSAQVCRAGGAHQGLDTELEHALAQREALLQVLGAVVRRRAAAVAAARPLARLRRARRRRGDPVQAHALVLQQRRQPALRAGAPRECPDSGASAQPASSACGAAVVVCPVFVKQGAARTAAGGRGAPHAARAWPS